MKTLITSITLPRLITATILGTVALGCSAPSMADDKGEVPHAVVKFGDLDVSSSQGAAKLYSRIAAAAEAVCNPFQRDERDLEGRAQFNACVDKAIVGALTKAGQPALVAIYNAKSGQPLPIMVAQSRAQ